MWEKERHVWGIMSKISPAEKELENDVNDLKDIWESGKGILTLFSR